MLGQSVKRLGLLFLNLGILIILFCFADSLQIKASAAEATGITYSYYTGGSWSNFSGTAQGFTIDGIKIQTDPQKGYYLKYKTRNYSKDGFYPEVTSIENDYAGSRNLPIQLLNISAYRNNGEKLSADIVVMYRAYVEGRWLPWVSNAAPAWMQSVYAKYGLDGTIDTSGSFAGIPNKNITGIQIKVFEEQETIPYQYTDTEVSPVLSTMVNNETEWTGFNQTVTGDHFDGIKIQTDPGKGYYLKYQTYNEGSGGFFSEVNSTANEYAGLPGRPIQQLRISVYNNNNVKLSTNVVVLYRVRVDGQWLPWVSNANADWMYAAQLKYRVGGTLDASASYAGMSNKNISGIEIRVFEDTQCMTQGTPAGDYKMIDAPFISQIGTFPTGCESVSAVMALRHAGFNMSVDTFVDSYLQKSSFPFDPNESFGGDPRSSGGYGCYAPVIQRALDTILRGTGYRAVTLTNVPLSVLCSEYVKEGIPVITWATMSMAPSRTTSWHYNDRTITWIQPEHCLLLVGYDEQNYIFNDPLKTGAQTFYNREAAENAYAALLRQAVVIVRDGIEKGDVNADGVFDIKDLIRLKMYVAQIEDTDIHDWAADMNGDGGINSTDIVMIRRKLLGI